MQDKLLLLHEFLNDITHVANEDELTGLAGSYREKLRLSAKEDVIYKLWNDARMLGSELLLRNASGTDTSRSRKLAALTAEEKNELAEVERIIDENCIDYHFQPIVNTVDGGIYSYEALMRPRSDIGLKPYHILKYAELTGRLNDIERATFLNVLNIIDRDKEKFKDRRVFINSIPKTKLDGDDFRHVGELLMKHSDTAVVELTEQAELDENELNALKERYLNMDIRIALDDYGTGYSNVQNLLRYMPNYVKIDHSLLNDIQNSPNKRHFVREIIEFCHDNGIMALAEGVETSEELRTVILLGADLIQGFYTARPNAEILDCIPYEIRQEIKLCQQERQDGKDQQVYATEATERVLLERLVKNDYQCILIGKGGTENGEVTIIGSPSLDTDMHIEIAEAFKGKVILENVHLSSVKNCPCIDLAENSDITLVIKGENKLKKGGIRVLEGAGFTLEGDGSLDIYLDSPEYFGIGNDNSSKHGELIFKQSGTVTINASGKLGVGIGAGYGGNIAISQGKYVLNINGDAGVGIGTLFADCKLDIFECDLNTDISLSRGVAIGSIGNNVDIHISKAIAKLYMGGEELAAIGTLDGDRANVLIDDANVIANIRANRCTCVGALDQNTSFRAERAAYRATAGGEKALPFGGFGGDAKISLINADTTIKLETDVDIEKYIQTDYIEVVSGRTIFMNYGKEIELKETSNMEKSTLKTVIVTGANSGLGFETAKKIAANSEFRVILACRNQEKAEQAAARIKSETSNPYIVCMALDTASLKSVRQFEKDYIQTGFGAVYALLCNAGISGTHTGLTEDGFDVVFQTNHLGHFLLTKLMLPYMAEEGKIFITSSDMHDAPGGNMVWSGTEALAHPNEKLARERVRYSYSKLCNLYFTYELTRRLCNSDKKLYVNAFNPGLMKTNFMPLTKESMDYVKTAMPHRFGDLEKSSAALAELVLSEQLVTESGQYYDRSVNTCPSSELSYIEKNAAELWEASENYVEQ